MGKLIISKELSDKISKSLKIKQSDIADSGANKPIIRKVEPPKKESPVKSPCDSSKQNSPVKRLREEIHSQKESPIKSPIEHPIKKQWEHQISYPKKSHKQNKPDKVNYLKISKIVFLSSIVGGIGITLGIKIGTILFL